MKFKQKMFTLYCVPMLVYGILLLCIGLIQFENGMYKETRNSLKIKCAGGNESVQQPGLRGLRNKV